MAMSDVALFRGLNVTAKRRVDMAELRALLEELGYHDVRTVLGTGNALLSAPTLPPLQAAAQIEQAFAARFGFESRTTVLTGAELAAMVEENPLLDVATDATRLCVGVLADPDDRKLLRPLLARGWAPEDLAVGVRAAYLWCPGGLIASPLASAVQAAVASAVTMRSWDAMLKLAAAAAGGPATAAESDGHVRTP